MGKVGKSISLDDELWIWLEKVSNKQPSKYLNMLVKRTQEIENSSTIELLEEEREKKAQLMERIKKEMEELDLQILEMSKKESKRMEERLKQKENERLERQKEEYKDKEKRIKKLGKVKGINTILKDALRDEIRGKIKDGKRHIKKGWLLDKCKQIYKEQNIALVPKDLEAYIDDYFEKNLRTYLRKEKKK